MSFLEQHDQLSQFAFSVIKSAMTGGMAWGDFANYTRLPDQKDKALFTILLWWQGDIPYKKCAAIRTAQRTTVTSPSIRKLRTRPQ